MGVVYEALDKNHGTKVALKVLPLVSPERLLRFKREFRVASGIDHPNLVRLGELVRFGDHWFFTMELVAGVDVVEHVRGVSPPPAHSGPRTLHSSELPASPDAATIAPTPSTAPRPSPADLRKVQQVLPQLAAALAVLHEAGCVHRDVKPSNVMVTPDGRLVLLDFGLASIAAQESTLFVAGTPLYMAPEQAANAPATPAADWYSFGVLMFELLTGTLPFRGNMYEVLSAKQAGPAPSVRSVLPEVPEALGALCDALLAPDPKLRPSGREVLERLGLPGDPRSRRLVASAREKAPLIGREHEWDVLKQALAQVRERGSGLALVLRGESGVGKSTLARAFLDAEVQRGDVLAFFSRCYERELVPYKAVDGLLDAIAHFLRHAPDSTVDRVLPARASVIAQVFPVLARVEALARTTLPDVSLDRREVRTWLFAALRELMSNIGREKTVIALIDDLHWADNDSMMLLSELLREPGSPRVLLLCTQRTQEPLPGAKVFAREVEERTLTLGNLSPSAARALAEQLSESGEQPLNCAQLAEESGGHPLFLRELLEAASRGADTNGAITLDAVIMARIAKLTPEPTLLLRLLAVSGAPLEASVLREASGLGGNEFGDALHALRAARLIHAAGEIFDDRLDISHDRLRRVVRAELSQEDVEGLHRQLAGALELRGDPVLSATHWREAQHPERAAQHFASAGRMALEALAFGDAASHYRAALSLGKWGDAERMSLLSALGDALSNAGKGAEAAQQYRNAAQTPGETESTHAVELKRRAAEELVRSGYLDEGLKVAQEVLADADLKPAKSPLYALLMQRSLLRMRGLRFREKSPDELSPKQLARIDLCWSMSSGLVLTDTYQGAYFLARGLSLSLRAGEPYRVARSIAAEGAYNASRGARHRARSDELLDLAEQLSERTKDPRATGTVLLMRGIAAHLRGDFSEGRSLSHRASAVLREQCTGMFWERDAARQFWLECLFYLGDLKTLREAVRSGLREADERGAIYTATNLRTGLANAIWLIDDAPDEAQSALSEAMRHWSVKGFHVQHWYALIGESHLRLYQGRPVEAKALMEARWAELAGSHLLRVNHTRVVAQHLHGRTTLAAALASQAQARAEGIAAARRIASMLARREKGWGELLAQLLELGAQAALGTQALEARARALAERLDQANLGLYAAALRCAALGESAPLEAEGVRDPAKFAAVFVPGFPSPR